MKPIIARGVETGVHFMGSSAAFVLSLYSLMIAFLTSPAPAALPLPLPPSLPLSLLLLPLLPLQRWSAPVVCVTVDPCKEDRSNISPPVYEAFRWGLADMMIGADGWTGAPGFEVCNRQRWL